MRVNCANYCNIFPIVPSPPLNVAAHHVTSTSITVIWEPPQSPNGRLLGYEVSYTPHRRGHPSVVIVQNITSWKLTGLKPYTVHAVSVRAKTAAGFGGYGNPVTQKTLEDGKILILMIHAHEIPIYVLKYHYLMVQIGFNL